MAESAAPSRPLSLRLPSGGALELAPKLEIGAGGEARVFAHPRDRRSVVKLYKRPSGYYERKIGRMIAAPPVLDSDAVRLTWPREMVHDAAGGFAGYLMDRAEGPRIFEFYNPATRRAKAPLFHWKLLHRTAHNVAAAFAALHDRGYVVGDVNESNVLVSRDGAVTLVDTDGFQVPDPDGGYFRPRVGRPEFTAPELQGTEYAAADRTEAHDRFGLGVMIFLTLMEGTHPFAIRLIGGGELPPLEERIRRGMFPYPEGVGLGAARAARLSPPFGSLHPRLQELFVRCFSTGHERPELRPPAREWQMALAEAEADLKPCPANQNHFYASHLPACAWCRRSNLLVGRDPFPHPQGSVVRAAPARNLPAAPSADPGVEDKMYGLVVAAVFLVGWMIIAWALG